jgi:hypothetical protein
MVLPPRGHFTTSRDLLLLFWSSQLEVGEVLLACGWGQTRDIAEHPVKHRVAPMTKNDLTQSVNGAETVPPS